MNNTVNVGYGVCFGAAIASMILNAHPASVIVFISSIGCSIILLLIRAAYEMGRAAA